MVDREYSSAQLGRGGFMGLLDALNRLRGKGQQKKVKKATFFKMDEIEAYPTLSRRWLCFLR
jgi:hypothetical protein